MKNHHGEKIILEKIILGTQPILFGTVQAVLIVGGVCEPPSVTLAAKIVAVKNVGSRWQVEFCEATLHEGNMRGC